MENNAKLVNYIKMEESSFTSFCMHISEHHQKIISVGSKQIVEWYILNG